jgi:hypothetical protein
MGERGCYVLKIIPSPVAATQSRSKAGDAERVALTRGREISGPDLVIGRLRSRRVIRDLIMEKKDRRLESKNGRFLRLRRGWPTQATSTSATSRLNRRGYVCCRGRALPGSRLAGIAPALLSARPSRWTSVLPRTKLFNSTTPPSEAPATTSASRQSSPRRPPSARSRSVLV